MHLAELFVLLRVLLLIGIILEGLEEIVFGVIGAGEGLVFLQVDLGVIVLTQELKRRVDASFSLRVVALVE